MGAQWKNAGKAAAAAAKGKIFTKLAREIQVASKLGGPDPDANPRLRMAIDAAREVSCPKDTIERAIRKGAGLDQDAAQIEEVTYEGYGPHKVGVMVECLTDNRNRTGPEVRSIFKSHDGQLGEIGSVAWMFDRLAMVDAVKVSVSDPEEDAIEAGANEVEKTGADSCVFWGAVTDLEAMRSGLGARGWTIKQAALAYKPKNITDLSEAQKKDVIEFLEALDNNDDVNKLYTTVSF
jgi:YebC/PmpR family DNA-binding regulatory protein